ncbi:MAG: MFS transporter [bacterium]|nr:MFS transporter [bacterium]
MRTDSGVQVGYVELIRTNGNLRRIWLGDIASLLGDWFNTIAIYTLVERLTGSPLALGWVFITKSLPWALASPFAGLIADRLNRRRLMIVADLLRAVVVLGFLLIDEAGDVAFLYALTAIQIAIGAVFVPARSASIPNVTSPRELLTANALMAATWSTLLAVGAALGGVATAWLGVRVVFLIDSATYCVSALFILRTVIPQSTEKSAPGPLVATALDGVVSGWRYMLAHPRVGRIALVKAVWVVGGGALVYMLALLGTRIVPDAPAIGIGLLFAARGLGTGLGPIAARAWLPARRWWPGFFGCGIVSSGLVYLVVGSLDWSVWVIGVVVLGHATSGANWVLSTVLLQERTSDRYRGRVFSTEWLLLTLVDTLAILTASLLLEAELLSLRSGFLVFAGIQIACGLLWLVLVVPHER